MKTRTREGEAAETDVGPARPDGGRRKRTTAEVVADLRAKGRVGDRRVRRRLLVVRRSDTGALLGRIEVASGLDRMESKRAARFAATLLGVPCVVRDPDGRTLRLERPRDAIAPIRTDRRLSCPWPGCSAYTYSDGLRERTKLVRHATLPHGLCGCGRFFTETGWRYHRSYHRRRARAAKEKYPTTRVDHVGALLLGWLRVDARALLGLTDPDAETLPETRRPGRRSGNDRRRGRERRGRPDAGGADGGPAQTQRGGP